MARGLTEVALVTGGDHAGLVSAVASVLPSAAWQRSAAVTRYAEQAGRLDFAAPQDWMCEPFMIERTSLSDCEHQERTVANYLELRRIAPACRSPRAARLAARRLPRTR